jgi:predicted dehydrogenase
VTAYASRIQNLEVEDTAQLTLRLENGATGSVDLSWSSGTPAASYLEIYGEDGCALLDSGGLSYKFKTWNEWKRIPNETSAEGAFARQIDHFIETISGRVPTRLNNNDGLAAQALIETAYQSLERERSSRREAGENLVLTTARA